MSEGKIIKRDLWPTGRLRWHVPNRVDLRPPVLQQELYDKLSDYVTWRSIPVHVSDEYSEGAA